MYYCSNCGAQLYEGTAVCPSCGAAQGQNPENQQIVNYPEPVYQYQEPVDAAPQGLTGNAKTFGLISMICGIASYVVCCVGPLCGIAAVILGILGKKATPEGTKNTMANVGLILGAVGIGVSILANVFGFFSGFLSSMMGI